MDDYTRINTLRFPSSHINKVMMKCGAPSLDAGISTVTTTKSATQMSSHTIYDNDIYFILAGLDLKLFDLDLNLVDEHSRKTIDNTCKFASMIKADKFAVATNSNIEIYALVCLGGGGTMAAANQRTRKHKTNINSYVRIKELKYFVNAHDDSISCLSKLTESVFASGSSDGHIILWQSDTLLRVYELRPFDELARADDTKRLALPSVTSFRCLLDVLPDLSLMIFSFSLIEVFLLLLFKRYILSCCGYHIAIYDVISNEFVFKVLNAHRDSKLVDLVVLR